MVLGLCTVRTKVALAAMASMAAVPETEPS